MNKDQSSIPELGTRVSKTKKAIDSLERNLAGIGGPITIYFGHNKVPVELPEAFTTPVVRAIQAILKQGMTLDAVTLAELVGLPPPKLSEDDHAVTIRMAQRAITDGSEQEDEEVEEKKSPQKLPERCQ